MVKGKDPKNSSGSPGDVGVQTSIDPESPEEEINATMWRVLREAILTAIARKAGRRPLDYTLEQQNEQLTGLESALISFHAQLVECGRQHYLLGRQRVHDSLHAGPGAQHDLIDQVAEFETVEELTDMEPPLFLED